MKILLVSPEYPPHNIGGGGVVVWNLAHALSEKGHKVTVVSGYYPTKSVLEKVTVFNHDGIKVFWLPLLPTPRVPFQLKTILPPNVSSLVFLFRLLLNNQYDLINIHGYGHFLNDFAGLTARLLRQKYVATIHGIPKQPKRQSGPLEVIFRVYSKTLGSMFLLGASIITAVSRPTAREVVALGGDFGKIIVIPNGIDCEAFRNSTKEEQDFIKRKYATSSKRLILGLGRLSEAKGFQFLLHAMPTILKTVPHAYLVIAGEDGGYRDKLIKIVDKLNLRNYVKFAGKIEEETKRRLISAADVVVIPSIVEPFGIVALEAMSAGKPIIASDVEGLAELLKNRRNSRLAPPGNSKEIADNILAVLADTSSHRESAYLSREEELSFSWKSIGELYIKAYLRVK